MANIGIDARFYGEAGPGRYTKAIIQHLEKIDHKNQYYIFLRKKGFEQFELENPHFKKVLADYQWYSFLEQTIFLAKLLRYKLDLFYVPHFNIPILYPKTLITAIPDLIMHTFSTEKGTTLPKPYFRLKKAVYKAVFKWAVIRSKKIIVPSKAVIGDFQKVYPNIPTSKYVLAYEGVDPDLMKLHEETKPQEVLDKLQIKTPYLLYIGSAYEHKNLYRLVDAFKLLKEEYRYEGSLVIAGKKDRFAQTLHQYIIDQNLSQYIRMPGLTAYVTDQEIIVLRTQAQLYIFPSLKEGFSLTPMEAQAVSLPAIISDIPIHREIYQDSVEYFDPTDTNDIAETINEVLHNETLQRELIEKGCKNISRYDWNTTAEITLKVFKEILS